jgi:hypothetical protein
MEYAGAVFLIQGASLLGLGMLTGWIRFDSRFNAPAAGLLLAAALYAVVAPLAGRTWSEAEVIGVMPDPTAIATLAVLAASRGAVRWAFMVVPLLWLAVSAVTLHTLGAPDFLLPAAAAVLGLGLALLTWRNRG